jgi:hypothetical protein
LPKIGDGAVYDGQPNNGMAGLSFLTGRYTAFLFVEVTGKLFEQATWISVAKAIVVSLTLQPGHPSGRHS